MPRTYLRLSIAPSIILLTALFVCVAIVASFKPVEAYGECNDYGYMAMYDILTDSCKCMSGYVMKTNFLGDLECVSGNSMCTDKYGYNSRYDSLSDSCECSYGYQFGKDFAGRTQCISQDQMCQDVLGYNSSYNIGSGKCTCSYGYIINNGQCKNGDSVCRADHGLFSDYNTTSNRCECDYGYTLDSSSQCVKKQNNAYFKLLDVNTIDKTAIIKSDFDGSRYHITYGSGCYSTSMNRNVNDLIVVNLGTDFFVDRYDMLVLPYDNETCDIRSVSRTYFDSFEEMYPDDEEDEIYYIPSVPVVSTPVEIIDEHIGGVIESGYAEANGGSAASGTLEPEVKGWMGIGQLPAPTTSTTSLTTSMSTIEKEGLIKRIWGKIRSIFSR